MNSRNEDVDQKFILLHPKDNTITALRDLVKGEEIIIEQEGTQERILLRDPVAYAHKAARIHVSKGSDVVKYGEVIGVATDHIQPGDHVHVHNVDGKLAKRDEP